MPPKLPTNHSGILGALEVYGRLITEGFHVYVPVAYVGHDCIVKKPSGKHFNIEIKSREPGKTNFWLPENMKHSQNSDENFVILHYYGTDESWVLPWAVAWEHRSNTDRIILGQKMKETLHQYKNAYHLIR